MRLLVKKQGMIKSKSAKKNIFTYQSSCIQVMNNQFLATHELNVDRRLEWFCMLLWLRCVWRGVKRQYEMNSSWNLYLKLEFSRRVQCGSHNLLAFDITLKLKITYPRVSVFSFSFCSPLTSHTDKRTRYVILFHLQYVQNWKLMLSILLFFYFK